MCVDAVTSYTAERGELDGGRQLLTKKKSASSGLKDTRWRIRKHNCPTKKEEGGEKESDAVNQADTLNSNEEKRNKQM